MLAKRLENQQAMNRHSIARENLAIIASIQRLSSGVNPNIPAETVTSSTAQPFTRSTQSADELASEPSSQIDVIDVVDMEACIRFSDQVAAKIKDDPLMAHTAQAGAGAIHSFHDRSVLSELLS